jgi:hypothetical protein
MKAVRVVTPSPSTTILSLDTAAISALIINKELVASPYITQKLPVYCFIIPKNISSSICPLFSPHVIAFFALTCGRCGRWRGQVR